MKSGTAYVSEIGEDEHFLTGRFEAFWDRSDGPSEQVGDLSFEEAVAWARERSDSVLVDIGVGTRYSAGERAHRDFPPLPAALGPFARRRDPEFAYLDRTESDPPIRWQASLSFALEGERLGGFAKRFDEAVRSDGRIESAAGEADPDSSWIEMEVVLTARTPGEAQRIADGVLHAAMDAAGAAGDKAGGRAYYAGTGNLQPVR